MANFTFAHYKRTLEKALAQKYTFLRCRDFSQIGEREKIITMRHDIDFSLKNAYIIAQIEAELEIKSTYFIRLHAHAYNPLQLHNYELIQQIKDLGHEIGLHQEPDFAAQTSTDKDSYLQGEIASFNQLFQVTIAGISTHEPVRTGKQVTPNNIHKFPLEYESYFPVFLEQMKYISDSGGRWREGCMSEWIARNEPKIYVLTHPVWWYKNTPLENY